jgi:hypothetical protein
MSPFASSEYEPHLDRDDRDERGEEHQPGDE